MWLQGKFEKLRNHNKLKIVVWMWKVLMNRFRESQNSIKSQYCIFLAETSFDCSYIQSIFQNTLVYFLLPIAIGPKVISGSFTSNLRRPIPKYRVSRSLGWPKGSIQLKKLFPLRFIFNLLKWISSKLDFLTWFEHRNNQKT